MRGGGAFATDFGGFGAESPAKAGASPANATASARLRIDLRGIVMT